MASGSGDLRGAGAMDQGDDQITQGGHNLGGMTGAQAGTVFAKADIAHIVRTFLVSRQEGSLPPARLQNRT